MSRNGHDLLPHYLSHAARSAIRHNPAVRALYARLQARGKRGDVALGHCMRKLLHLVFAIWKTGRPFDAQHYPWQPAMPSTSPTADNEKTAGHTQDKPDRKVVTAAALNVPQQLPENQASDGQAPTTPATTATGSIDFADLRRQVSMEQVLAQLGWLSKLKGSGPQRRGPCPVHADHDVRHRSFSVHL